MKRRLQVDRVGTLYLPTAVVGKPRAVCPPHLVCVSRPLESAADCGMTVGSLAEVLTEGVRIRFRDFAARSAFDPLSVV